MKRLITYEKAKKEVEILQNYIYLIEAYEIKNINSWIIKNYALTNSIAKVIKNSNNPLLSFNNQLVTKEQVLEIIKKKPIDELHNIVYKGYMKKIKRKY